MSTPDHAIAKVADPGVREAILTVRTEFFMNLSGLTAKVDVVSQQVTNHVAACTEERRADAQWRESATRILNEFKASIAEYIASNSRDHKDIHARIDNQIVKAQGWVIGILVSVIGASWVIIWKLLEK